jgi:transglutaminase-like putative cysteine protease
MFRLKVGCQLRYFSSTTTPAVFVVQPPPHPRQMLVREAFQIAGGRTAGEFLDAFGNRCQRVSLAPGENVIHYDALATVPIDPDVVRPTAREIPPAELPSSLLRYTLPSRYAETDKLLAFAWNNFARLPAGWERAAGICEWVHRHVQYKSGVSVPQWSAADAIARGQGVCRDRAHAVIALCRAFNMPARYAVSYLPDIDVPEDGLAPDFHAYAEVYLEGGWQVFDPHGLRPRKGRVFISSGLDAADAAFATIYGGARLTAFQVWSDPVDEREQKLDLSRPPPAPAPPPEPIPEGIPLLDRAPAWA